MNYERKVISYKGYEVFEKTTIPAGTGRMPKNSVANEACFLYLNHGEFSVRSADSCLRFDRNKALLSKCVDYFFENLREQATFEYIQTVGVLLHQPVLEELFEFDSTSFGYTSHYNIKHVVIDHALEQFKQNIELLVDNPALANEAMIALKLKEFVILLSQVEEVPSQLEFITSLFKKKETDFRVTIRNNLYTTLSIDELARLCGMGITTFKKVFKEQFKESPARYLLKKKLEHAAELLMDQDHRISDIAYDCGFESITTFNRNFKSFYSKSPGEFRHDQID